jgi:hypothetical protein
VYVVGVGTLEGASVPARPVGVQEPGQSASGDRPSRLNEALLRRLADETHGRYISLTPDGAASLLQSVYAEDVGGLTQRSRGVWPDAMYRWSIAASLVLLSTEMASRVRGV